MINEQIIYGGDNKSYLRKKWDYLFQIIALSRIPEFYKNEELVNNVLTEQQLKDLIDPKNSETNNKWKTVILTFPLNNFVNLVGFFDKLDSSLNEEAKVIVSYYSKIWKPFFFIFSLFGLIRNYKNSLFFSKDTLEIFLRTGNFEISKKIPNYFIPFNIPIINKFLSILINFLPFLDNLSVTKVFYLRKKNYKKRQNKKISLIIPCKNEQGNILNIVTDAKKELIIPYEIIFVDDKSSDNTFQIIIDCKKKFSDVDIQVTKGPGKGKSLAVNEGIKIATGYYSIIFDADMTVNMKDINVFYNAISNGNADIINGSRLVYKPYTGAMRYLNFLGNKFFSKLSSFITGELITDTLCGSKCFITKDFKIFNEFKDNNNINDIWGDFNILYSSNFYGLKCIDLPVRYYERVEGETKMKKRFYFFLNMLSTSIKAMNRFKINFDKKK